MKVKTFTILYIGLVFCFCEGSLLAAEENTHLKLPSGPSSPGPFGAYYIRLYYSPEWEKPWRVGDYADVVVRFDTSPVKFVFWRGASYVPCWVTENGIWYTNQWWETSDIRDKDDPMVECEPIMDKQCRYSHVRVIESNNARVVVHWRYALSNLDYRLPYVNESTGWGDWADEYYTIYPDATCIRKLTCWSTYPHGGWFGDPNEGIAHRECHESIIINQPGTKPEENIELAAVTLANLKGQDKTYVWENGAPEFPDQPENACIQMINLKAKYKPFMVVEPEKVWFKPFREFAGKSHAPGSNFFCFDHWPVSQEENAFRFIISYDRPSHTSLCHIIWPAYEKTDNSITKILLNGLTEKSADELAMLAKSWINPPNLKLLSKNFLNKGYDKTQKAYILACEKKDKPSKLEFELIANENSPLVNPAFVIKDWGQNKAELIINGKPIKQGNDYRIAYRKGLKSIDLIVWIELENVQLLKIELDPFSS